MRQGNREPELCARRQGVDFFSGEFNFQLGGSLRKQADFNPVVGRITMLIFF